jgi:hypothetical protein
MDGLRIMSSQTLLRSKKPPARLIFGGSLRVLHNWEKTGKSSRLRRKFFLFFDFKNAAAAKTLGENHQIETGSI